MTVMELIEFNEKLKNERICFVCKKLFKFDHPNKAYCSGECRKQANRKKKA